MSVQGDHELVVQDVKDKGHYDELRKKVLEQLKHDPNLRADIMRLMEESEVAKDSAKLLTLPKKKALEEMRREFDAKLMAKAMEVADRIITAEQGLFADLLQKHVHESLCTLYTDQVKKQVDEQAAAVSRGR
mmetsp:Transcript_21835/g.55576  ORF Transcript_21835/g.55576 Transcript_21835/m.55576 type:complete len:132 (-) Transcript_21835:545-940(-)